MQSAPPTLITQNRPPLWGILIAMGLALVAGQPYVLGRLVLGTDTNFHAHRLWQTVQMIREGILFARWTPDIAYGFGVPLFNAHGPLPYYLAAPLVFLTGGQVYLAYVLALIGFLILASLCTYLWLRTSFGEWGGLVGAAVFVFAADMLTNVSLRGTLAEPLALAVLPLILWATERVIARQQKFVGVGAFCYALLALNHNATLFLFTPTLLLYALALCLSQPQRRVAALLRMGMMLAWGLALAAFYIVPAFIERNELALGRILAKPELNFHNSFISLGWLLSNPLPLDEAMMAREYPVHLGATAALLSALAVLALLRRQKFITVRVLISLFLVALCTFMMLPQSVALWEAVPLLQVLQFARRFAPLASLWMAPLAAAGCWALMQTAKLRGLRIVFPALAIGALAITAFPVQFPQAVVPLNRPLDALTIMQDEQDMHAFGTTLVGEYTPIANKQLPTPEKSPLLRGGQRLDPDSVPADATILSQSYAPLNYAVAFKATQSFVATFNTFYYPGWQAFVDDVAVPITPSAPFGFIQVNVPAGEHGVQIVWGSTPLRRATEVISIAAWVVLALRGVGRRTRDRSARSGPIPEHAPWPAAALILFITLGLVFAFKTFIADVRETPWRTSRFDGQNIKDLAQKININFGGRMILMGAEKTSTVPSGGTLQASLHWRVAQAPSDNFSTSLQAVDANGVLVGVSDHQQPSRAPTSWNSLHNYTRDDHALRILPGTPPGQYKLRVQAAPFDQFDKPLPVLNEAGSVTGVFYELGTVEVQRPAAPALPADLKMSYSLTASSNAPIQLIGFDAPQHAARTGDRLPISLFWRSQTLTPADEVFTVSFVAKDGATIRTPARALVQGYATHQWQAGDVWRGTHAVLVPPKLVSDSYRVFVQMAGAPDIAIGEVQIESPTRTFDMPKMARPQRAQFGAVMALAGYTLSSNSVARGQPFTLTLAWQAVTETPISYKVFVHLVNAEGQLVASDDAVPAQWQRPTPGWATGEFVLDAHPFNLSPDLPAGIYSLQVGVYEEGGAGARLALNTGEPFVTLSQTIKVLP